MSWAFKFAGSKAAVKQAIDELPVYGRPDHPNTMQLQSAKVYAKYAIDATPGDFVDVDAAGHTDIGFSEARVSVKAINLVGVSVVTPAATAPTDAEPAGEAPEVAAPAVAR